MRSFLTILTIITALVESSAGQGSGGHDNFMSSLGNDLRAFRVRKRGYRFPKSNDKIMTSKVKEVKETTSINDHDQAEETIFKQVERMEKAVLNSAGSLLHDEVDVLFGLNHGASLHKLHTKSKKNASNNKMKEMEEVHMKRRGSNVNTDEVRNISRPAFLHDATDFMFE